MGVLTNAMPLAHARVKREALDANRRELRAHRTELPQSALERAAELIGLLATRRHQHTELRPFAETVAAVLAGPFAETEPPKQ